jgi:hypothetical protein
VRLGPVAVEAASVGRLGERDMQLPERLAHLASTLDSLFPVEGLVVISGQRAVQARDLAAIHGLHRKWLATTRPYVLWHG